MGKITAERFLLRWAFEYKDGKSKSGMWQHPGPKSDMHTKAWANKNNISYAVIERKDIISKQTKQIVRCLVSEFMNFQWVVVVNQTLTSTPRHRAVGLTLLSTEGVVTCYIDGSISREAPKYVNQNFSTY